MTTSTAATPAAVSHAHAYTMTHAIAAGYQPSEAYGPAKAANQRSPLSSQQQKPILSSIRDSSPGEANVTSPSRFFDHMVNTVATAAKVIEDQAAALERVRNLHVPRKDAGFRTGDCEACSTCCDDIEWPCATIKALDGDNAQA